MNAHKPLNLNTLNLTKGGHETPGDGLCFAEAVAYWAGEPHTDHPNCMSPVLGTFGRELNDLLDDAKRQLLVPLIPQALDTSGDGLDEARGYLALDWLIRTYTPAWLDLAGLTAEAAELRALRRIVDMASAEAAGPAVRIGRDSASAAWAAARDAAGAAARAAAWAAARDAAGAAAWAAARDAAWAAAWAAAGAAAWAAARGAAGAAAWAAARGALKPTVDQLQDSAIALFTAMIRPDRAA